MKYIRCLTFILTFIISSTSVLGQKNIEETNSSYYQEVKATHFISPTIMSLEDDVLIEMKSKGLILGSVSMNEDVEEIKQKWNKIYYEDLPHHYLKTEALEGCVDILKIENNSANDIINNWPGKLTDQEYIDLYKAIKVDLVDKFEITVSMKGKYIITPNNKYWDFTTQSDYPLLVDILSTYERQFDEYELVHDNLDAALDYAVIIFEALCNQRGPDNSYYYNQLALDQFPLLPEELNREFAKMELTRYKGLPSFNLNYYSQNRKEEYEKVINNQRENLKLSKKIFTNLPKPPFFIIKVLN